MRDVRAWLSSCCWGASATRWSTPSSPAIVPRHWRCSLSAATSNRPEADGTTRAALGRAPRRSASSCRRLTRAGANVNVAERLRRHADVGGGGHRQRRAARGAARGGRRRRIAERRRPDGADGGRAHAATSTAAARAARARRRRQRAWSSWRGQTALMWAAAQSQPAMVQAAAGARCRRQRPLDGQQLGAPGHRRAARHLPAGRRLDAAAVRGA